MEIENENTVNSTLNAIDPKWNTKQDLLINSNDVLLNRLKNAQCPYYFTEFEAYLM
jgi:hypothetical protein